MAKTAEQKAVKEAPSPTLAEGARTPIKWDTTNLRSSYANFCNANSTREEVVLNFGVNKTWERGHQDALDIELNHRIVLSPFAAKRLSELLQQLMKEYETRYGRCRRSEGHRPDWVRMATESGRSVPRFSGHLYRRQ